MEKEITNSERTEDKNDQMIADEAYRAYLENGKMSRPIKELWKEINL